RPALDAEGVAVAGEEELVAHAAGVGLDRGERDVRARLREPPAEEVEQAEAIRSLKPQAGGVQARCILHLHFEPRDGRPPFLFEALLHQWFEVGLALDGLLEEHLEAPSKCVVLEAALVVPEAEGLEDDRARAAEGL